MNKRLIIIAGVALTILIVAVGIYSYTNSTGYLLTRVEDATNAGNLEDAAKYLDKLSRKSDKKVAGESALKLYRVLYALDRPAEGFKALERAAECKESSAIRFLAKTLVTGSETAGVEPDPARAVEVLKSTDETDPQTTAQLLDLLLFHPEVRNPDDAANYVGAESKFNLDKKGYNKSFQQLYPYAEALRYQGLGGYRQDVQSYRIKESVYSMSPWTAVFAGNMELLHNIGDIVKYQNSGMNAQNALVYYQLALRNPYLDHDDLNLRIKYVDEYYNGHTNAYGDNGWEFGWKFASEGQWTEYHNSDNHFEFQGEVYNGMPNGLGQGSLLGQWTFMGHWSDGKPVEGVMVMSDGSVETGKFEDWRLVDGYHTEADAITTKHIVPTE